MATELKKTVKPSGQGGDYTTVNACLVAQQQNLVTADKYLMIEIDGDWTSATDSTQAPATGYTTDATRYIKIYTTGDARHNGVYGGNAKAYKHEVTNTSGGNFPNDTVTANVWYDGLQCKHTISSGVSYGCIAPELHVDSTSVWMKVSNNICVGAMSYVADGHNAGILVETYSAKTYIWNNICYGWKYSTAYAAGIWIYSVDSDGYTYVYNNTLVDNAVGFWHEANGTGTPILKNNIEQGSTGQGYIGAVSASSTNNLASDTSAPEYNTYYDSKTVDFVDAGAKNYHLDPSDADAKGNGANLYSDAGLAITTDIDGAARKNGTPWDIGADDISNAYHEVTGTTCWGHATGIDETNARDFTDNWSGTGTITGTGDSGHIDLSTGQYMDSLDIINTGAVTVTITEGKYDASDAVTIKYKTGATAADCFAVASWTTYSAPFASDGWVQIRIEAP